MGLSFISLSSPAAAQPITFRFEGTYDPSHTPPPEYAIDIGTPVQGEFSYDLATVDTAVGDDGWGFYEQLEPYRLEFQIGDSIFFQTDQYGFLGYRVTVDNDDSHFSPTRDVFIISARDSWLAASYGIDVVSANIHLQDLTAQAFDSDALPTDLSGFDLNAGAGWLFFNARNIEGDRAISVFGHRFRIDSIERVVGRTHFVDCDIKPGNGRNAINPMSRGVIPVAILGSEEFQVEEIDLTTLVFGSADPVTVYAVRGLQKDVNADGLLDLLAHFRTEESGVALGDTRACIAGETFEGMRFEGCDVIRTIPGGRGIRP
jgi:hypothetical protein